MLPEIISIDCLDQFDPKIIRIIFVGNLTWDVPRTIYDNIKAALGLPDVICGGD